VAGAGVVVGRGGAAQAHEHGERMKPWLDDGDVRLVLGDCVKAMREMAEVSVDLFSATAVTTLRCLDCGATASAGYQAPLPVLPPMPYPPDAPAPAARVVGGAGDATR
jgi:hypothetical protein